MNGFNAASSGSHNFTQDFSNPVLGHDLLGNNASVHHQRQQQHQSHPMLQQSATNPWQQQQQQQQHLMNPNGQMAPSNIHPQQMQLNPGAWNNQMGQAQQFANAMMPMGFNMPLISQQIIQEAVSMSTPVDAGDEPVLLTTLLRAKKAERSFREALNSLHGVRNVEFSTFLLRSFLLKTFLRQAAIPPPCGRTTIWSIKIASTTGLTLVLARRGPTSVWQHLVLGHTPLTTKAFADPQPRQSKNRPQPSSLNHLPMRRPVSPYQHPL